MAHRKIKFSPGQKAKLNDGSALKGKVLRVSVGVAGRMQNTLLRYIDKMVKETEREVRKLFEADEYAGTYGMDDKNIGSQARILTNKLYKRFEEMFDKVAAPITDQMVGQADKDSASNLRASIKEISENLEFSTDVMTPILREVISAGAAESVALIKRVPAKYLDNITTGIFQSITTGNGLQDILPLLEKQDVSVRNWAKNVAMDQTRKVYNHLNAGRMAAIGVTKYQWVHSGGSNHPRPYHRDVLNGQIFSLDDPPVIDLKTGERGKPGDAVFCRCTMRPVVEFST